MAKTGIQRVVAVAVIVFGICSQSCVAENCRLKYILKDDLKTIDVMEELLENLESLGVVRSHDIA